MTEHEMQHGIDWSGRDLAGWTVTEKLDGCRGYWDGSEMWSRGGHRISIPVEWREALPRGVHLDGEIYFGPHGRTKCSSAVRYGRFLSGMRFVVFDAPQIPMDYRARLHTAEILIGESRVVSVIKADIVTSTTELLEKLDDVHASEGEGLMCRHGGLTYRPGRTPLMVKVKHRWQEMSR